MYKVQISIYICIYIWIQFYIYMHIMISMSRSISLSGHVLCIYIYMHVHMCVYVQPHMKTLLLHMYFFWLQDMFNNKSGLRIRCQGPRLCLYPLPSCLFVAVLPLKEGLLIHKLLEKPLRKRLVCLRNTTDATL